MKIDYNITPLIRIPSRDANWRARMRVDGVIATTLYARSLAEIHCWISNHQHPETTEVVIELWEHSTFTYPNQYAKGKRIIAIQDDSDWVKAILCYEDKYQELFAKIE